MRHSSIQTADDPSGAWTINEKIFQKLDAGEVFFGLVELFDQSLIALEGLLRERGIEIDAPYPQALNRTTGPEKDRIDAKRLRPLWPKETGSSSGCMRPSGSV
jgi:hypothetical protein